MNDFEILIPITAILVGGTAVILPIAGLTARFAIKPVVEAIARLRATPGADGRVELLERRLDLLEEQYHALEREHTRLLEEVDFRRQLQGPTA